MSAKMCRALGVDSDCTSIPKDIIQKVQEIHEKAKEEFNEWLSDNNYVLSEGEVLPKQYEEETEANWIPTSTGKLPPYNVHVQITYFSAFTGSYVSDAFAFYTKEHGWVWHSTKCLVISKITAWRYSHSPYQEPSNSDN